MSRKDIEARNAFVRLTLVDESRLEVLTARRDL